MNISHVLTDGVGSLAVLAHLGDFTRDPRDIGAMPALPPPEGDSPLELAAEAMTYNLRRIVGFVGRSANVAARAIPTVLSRPAGAANTIRKNVRALVRVMSPSGKSLSPLIRQRRGWMRFAALEFDLQRLRKAAKSRGCTVNDAFVTAVAHGFALYHQRHGKPVERLRAVIAVNIRKEGDVSVGNHVRGESIAIPVGTEDPAGAMAIFHELLRELKEEAKLPSATALDGMLNTLGPAVTPLMGMMLKHDDLAISNIPAGDQTVYIAGAKVVGLYPFGPLMGTAANCNCWHGNVDTSGKAISPKHFQLGRPGRVTSDPLFIQYFPHNICGIPDAGTGLISILSLQLVCNTPAEVRQTVLDARRGRSCAGGVHHSAALWDPN